MKLRTPDRHALRVAGTIEISEEDYLALDKDDATLVATVVLTDESVSKAGAWTGKVSIKDLRVVAAADLRQRFHSAVGLPIPDRPLFNPDGGVDVPVVLEFGGDESLDDDESLGDALERSLSSDVPEVRSYSVDVTRPDRAPEPPIETTHEETISTPAPSIPDRPPTKDPILLAFLGGNE